jgi:hypothetical protein
VSLGWSGNSTEKDLSGAVNEIHSSVTCCAIAAVATIDSISSH